MHSIPFAPPPIENQTIPQRYILSSPKSTRTPAPVAKLELAIWSLSVSRVVYCRCVTLLISVSVSSRGAVTSM